MADFRIDKAALGTALSAALIGMAIGAIVGGAIGDRIGRKPAVACATAFFGLTTFATAYIGGLGELIGLRLISGLGFGIAFPNALALSAEWMPPRYRTITIAMGTVGSAVGGIIGAGVVAAVVPIGGWRGCFHYGGLFTVGFALLLALLLLESPDYLLKRRRADLLRKVLRSAFGVVDVQLPGQPIVQAPPRQPPILTRAYLRTNVVLWLSAIGYSVASFGTYSWTTTILVSIGLPLNAALLGASAYSTSALVGPFVCGTLATLLPSRTILLGLLGLWIAATLGLFWAIATNGGPALLYPMLGTIGFCAGAYAAVLYAAAAALYEPAARATGIGATIGVTRIGGILAAGVGGALLTVDPTYHAFYIGMAALLAISMLGVFWLPRTRHHREPQEAG